MTDDLDKLAKGLTAAQRDILDRIHVSTMPAWALRDDHLGAKAATDIRKMPPGVVEKVDMSRYGSQHWWYRLTPWPAHQSPHRKE